MTGAASFPPPPGRVLRPSATTCLRAPLRGAPGRGLAPAAVGARLDIERRLRPLPEGAQYEEGGRWVEAEVRGDEVVAPRCRSADLPRALSAAAGRGRPPDEGPRPRVRAGRDVVAPPSSWLLRPRRPPAGGRFRLRVAPPADARFVTGLFTGDADRVHEGVIDDLDDAPLLRVRSFTAAHHHAWGSRSIEVAIAPGLGSAAAISAWVDAAARDVAAYFGQYPVPRALVLVLGPARAWRRGRTLGNGGASIPIWVAPTTAGAALAADWCSSTRWCASGFPYLPARARWLEEGFATYVEPHRPRRQRAAQRLRGLGGPAGRPAPGRPRQGGIAASTFADMGEHVLGRRAFCFLADVAIRERTGDKRSLRDALRGVQAAGARIAVRWPLERTLAAGDARHRHAPCCASSTTRMGRDAWTWTSTTCGAGWASRARAGSVTFDDKAPLAAAAPRR